MGGLGNCHYIRDYKFTKNIWDEYIVMGVNTSCNGDNTYINNGFEIAYYT